MSRTIWSLRAIWIFTPLLTVHKRVMADRRLPRKLHAAPLPRQCTRPFDGNFRARPLVGTARPVTGVVFIIKFSITTVDHSLLLFFYRLPMNRGESHPRRAVDLNRVFIVCDILGFECVSVDLAVHSRECFSYDVRVPPTTTSRRRRAYYFRCTCVHPPISPVLSCYYREYLHDLRTSSRFRRLRIRGRSPTTKSQRGLLTT